MLTGAEGASMRKHASAASEFGPYLTMRVATRLIYRGESAAMWKMRSFSRSPERGSRLLAGVTLVVTRYDEEDPTLPTVLNPGFCVLLNEWRDLSPVSRQAVVIHLRTVARIDQTQVGAVVNVINSG